MTATFKRARQAERDFNPRSPRGGATRPLKSRPCARCTFQSTLPTRGSDAMLTCAMPKIPIFQSTLPTRGSDASSLGTRNYHRYFNPRSPRGGATYQWIQVARGTPISIHAPHEGERQSPLISAARRRHFNPRSPRGGATAALAAAVAEVEKFQSTLPTRGSDPPLSYLSGQRTDFNPRSPRGGATVYTQADGWFCPNFNPRSPRGGATVRYPNGYTYNADFNPRSPRGGATLLFLLLLFPTKISIHAPHEGERRYRQRYSFCSYHFNPRSPRGGATKK